MSDEDVLLEKDKVSSKPVPLILGSEQAPVIYFEAAPSSGSSAVSGVYSIMLSVSRPVPFNDGHTPSLWGAAACLKGSRPALESLRQAIDNALLLGARAKGPAN